MLPWEHAAVAYLLYSGYSRLGDGNPPGGWAVLLVLFASQLPDLIDKPLMWYTVLLPSGRSLGHSVFFGVPFLLAVMGLTRRYDRTSLGIALAIGHLSHLATEAVPLYLGRSTSFESILWPVLSYEPSSDRYDGFLEWSIDVLIGEYPSLLELEPTANVLIGLFMVGLVTVVWVVDGRPGVRELALLCRWPFRAMLSVARVMAGTR